MLILLVGNIFILPLAQFATWGRLGARSLMSLIIISGVMATVRDRRIILIASALALASFGIGWEDLERPNLYLHLLNNLDSVLFISFLIVLLTRQTFRAGPITPRRVQGSVAVYLLLGFLWSVLYEIVELLQPGSFSIVARNGVADIRQLGYFSLTTLTTLGFGDILPLSPLARSLTVLEALVGQLFPVILIARLVAMEIEYQRSSPALKQRVVGAILD
ncbi:MAG TPA: potassium channel family protein [Candidatus Binataceae bacterium]|nr:potassium channel family protein [Candidatus Binataceae bacterium]